MAFIEKFKFGFIDFYAKIILDLFLVEIDVRQFVLNQEADDDKKN